MRNEKVAANNNSETTNISKIPLELANYLHKTISKNVRESENMNEGIKTGVFPIHY